jgi:putative SOS response-associated peptidase YedK
LSATATAARSPPRCLVRSVPFGKHLAKLLVPAPAHLLVAHPVSTAVNSTRNDRPDLIAEAGPDLLVG